MTATKPGVRPVTPHFSSGPCAKRPGWSLQNLTDAVLGRSHRSKSGRAKLKRAIDLTREVLEVPADYRIGIVPASDTGAVEMALWSLLGARAGDDAGVGDRSAKAGSPTSKSSSSSRTSRVIKAPYGELPDLGKVDFSTDVVFTWNGTTSGVRVPNGDWIAARAPGSDDLRRNVGCFRAEARLAEARCGDLLLAEGAWRRRRAWHAHPFAARGRAARNIQAGLAAAKNFPSDQGRQAQRRRFRRRDDQHAIDALRGGLSRRAAMGEIARRVKRDRCALGCERQGAVRLGCRHAVGRSSREKCHTNDPIHLCV